MESMTLKILFYVEPRVEHGIVWLHQAWIDKFSFDIIQSLRRSEHACDFEFCITLNEAFRRFRDTETLNDIKKVYFTQEELLPEFADDWLAVGADWYSGTYSNELLSYYENLMSRKFSDFNPDIIICWTPVPFLNRIFPNALVLHHEASFINQPPYPFTRFFDPCGMIYMKGSFINKYTREINRSNLGPKEKQYIETFKARFQSIIGCRSPFKDIIHDLKKKYHRLALLPLMLIDSPVFYGEFGNKFRNQYQFVRYVLQNIPKEFGLIVVPFPLYYHDFIDYRTIDYLKKEFPNFISRPEFSNFLAPSQYLLADVDMIIGVSSSLCLQALIWNKHIVSLYKGYSIADAHQLDHIHTLSWEYNESKDRYLYWLLTRYSISDAYMNDPDWLSEYLISAYEKYSREGITCDFFVPIDNDEKIFNRYFSCNNKDIPQINYQKKWINLYETPSFKNEMHFILSELEKKALVGKHALDAKWSFENGKLLESSEHLERILDIDLFAPGDYRAVKEFVWQLLCGEVNEKVVLKTINCIRGISRKIDQKKDWPDGETIQWLHNLGIIMIRNKQWHAGLECLDFVMKKGKNITGTHYGRSVALFNINRFQEAKEAALAELKDRPEHQMARKILKLITEAKELDTEFSYSNKAMES